MLACFLDQSGLMVSSFELFIEVILSLVFGEVGDGIVNAMDGSPT